MFYKSRINRWLFDREQQTATRSLLAFSRSVCTRSRWSGVPEITRDWLYVRHKNERVMLYDQKADYHEQNNLVNDPSQTALMDEFDNRMAAHMASTGDDWDMAADFPPPDFLTHAEAKIHLENELLPNAIEVP